MNASDVKKVTVLGAGLMGSGIAQVCSQAGINVIMRDIKDDFLEKGMKGIKDGLGKVVSKGKMTQEDADAIVSRIETTTDLARAATEADLIIEAIPEDMKLKKEVYKEVSQNASENAIIASNTSTLSINEMANAIKNPENFLGLHFFNPAPVMKLVEVVRGKRTSDDVVQFGKDFATRVGKTPVVCIDSPGFIANRVALPIMIEAVAALEEGVASKEDIDTAVELGYNHPMGPLKLADLVGIDTVLHSIKSVGDKIKSPKWKAPKLLEQMVKEGRLGRKTGRGFYEYPPK